MVKKHGPGMIKSYHLILFKLQRLIPNRHLIVRSQQWKCQHNLHNLVKVNNKGTMSNVFLA